MDIEKIDNQHKGLVKIINDPNHLRQVILTLVFSAVKTTRFSEVSIECKYVVEEA